MNKNSFENPERPKRLFFHHNQKNGYYEGRIIQDQKNKEKFYGDCLPIAVLNYLKSLGYPDRFTENAESLLANYPQYNFDDGSISVAMNPKLIEGMLGNKAKVRLCVPQQDIEGLPENMRHYFIFEAPSTIQEFPFIGVTKKGPGITHTFCVTLDEKNNPIIVDNDGEKYPIQKYQINGYFQIGGLERSGKKKAEIPSKFITWLKEKIAIQDKTR